MSLQLLAPLLEGRRPDSDGLRSHLLTSIVVELHRRGHRIDLFTLAPDPSDEGHYRGNRLDLFVGTYRPRGRWCDAFRSERRQLTGWMGASRCELVNAHWSYEFALAALSCGKPALVTLHDWAPQVLRHHRDVYRLVRWAMHERTLRRATHLTANSPYIAEEVRRHTGRSVPVVPNGLSFGDVPRRADGRADITVGAMNNGFAALKNIHRLMEAFLLVRQQRPDIVLRLAGADFGPRGPAESWARERGLDGGVEFIGPIAADRVRDFMSGLDLFVHPSLEESFGMVLLEALAAGTPVIAGQASGAVPWVLGDGRAGSLVDVTSPGAIAAEVLRLAADAPARAAAACRGRAEVAERFSLDRVVDQYEHQYRAVLAAGVGAVTA